MNVKTLSLRGIRFSCHLKVLPSDYKEGNVHWKSLAVTSQCNHRTLCASQYDEKTYKISLTWYAYQSAYLDLITRKQLYKSTMRTFSMTVGLDSSQNNKVMEIKKGEFGAVPRKKRLKRHNLNTIYKAWLDSELKNTHS